MKRFLLASMVGIMLVSCSDKIAGSDNNGEDEKPVPVFVDVTFNESTAEVDIPEAAVGINCSSGTSADIVLSLDSSVTKEYIYRVKGYSANGSLTINSAYKLTLLLAGVDITCTTNAPAVHINCGKRISVILQENTENSFADNVRNEKRGAFYTKGHLEFQGGGTLNLRGYAKHALCAKEYIRIKKGTGTINILKAAGDGIHCGKGDQDPENNYFRMNGGTLNFSNVTNDLIDCDDYGCAYINGGTLNLSLESYGNKGLKADSIIYVSDGVINLNVEGTSAIGIQSNYKSYFSGGTISGTVNAYGAIGIKGNNSKSSVTVLGGGDLCFNGSRVQLSVSGEKAYGIYAEADLEAIAGDVQLSGLQANEPGYKVGGAMSGEKYFMWTELAE